MSSTFRLLTFGGGSLTDAEGRVVPLSRHRLALLVVVSVAGDRGVSRDKLLALCWPDTADAVARARLDQMLHAIRRALGGAIFQHGQPLRGNEAVLGSDARDFDLAVRAGAHADALALHHGPFLDGFHLGGMPELSRWIDTERLARTRAAIEAARALSASFEAAGNLAAALDVARRLTELAPEDERAARRLMMLLAQSGDRAAAIRCYEAFARRLAAELELAPSAETCALAARLRDGDVPRRLSA